MTTDSPDLWDPQRAGDYLGGVLPSLLARWRVSGRGPAFKKIGHRVRYARTDLDAWLADQTRWRTRDAA